ncbi:MAG: efflux RND transporter periplasmic adaptor subunit [Bacteroidetes bacterium]|nr:efflux RND transporter periplasmic adaptor subunit [Bacteroidota bacterium]
MALFSVASAATTWFYVRSSYIVIDNSQVRAELLDIRSEYDGRVEFSLNKMVSKRISKGDFIVVLNTDVIEEDIKYVEAKIKEQDFHIKQLSEEIKNNLELNDLKVNDILLQEGVDYKYLDISNINLSKSSDELNRSQELFKRDLIAVRQLADIKSEYEQNKLSSKVREISILQTKINKEKLDIEKKTINLKEFSLARLNAQRESLSAELNRLKIKLDRYSIKVDFDGVLDEVYVQPSEYISARQRLFTVHDPSSVYIEANIFESDIRFAHLNKKVKVKFDAFPDDSYEGYIDRIGSLTSSQQSVIPASKVVSNFIRIRQTFPLRIRLQNEIELKPGMMAKVYLEKSEN